MKNTILKLFLLFCAVPSIGQNVHPNLPWIDISGQRERQVTIAPGRPDL